MAYKLWVLGFFLRLPDQQPKAPLDYVMSLDTDSARLGKRGLRIGKGGNVSTQTHGVLITALLRKRMQLIILSE